MPPSGDEGLWCRCRCRLELGDVIIDKRLFDAFYSQLSSLDAAQAKSDLTESFRITTYERLHETQLHSPEHGNLDSTI